MATFATLEQLAQVSQSICTKSDARFRKLADPIAKTDLATALQDEITGKADAATTLTGYGITDAYTKTEVDNAIAESQASAAKPGGSLAAAGVVSSLLVEANEGKVYNLSEDVTTTSDFVEGAGHVLPAGMNIWVVNTASSGTAVYKFDVYGAAYGVATQSGNGLMSATDKAKLDAADVTAYTGTGAVDITNHVVSVAAASASTSGVGGNAGTMSAADKEKLDNADVTAYTSGNGISISNHSVAAVVDSSNANGLSVGSNGIALAPATASTSGVGGSNGAMTAADKEKLNGITVATSEEISDLIDDLFAD